MNGAMVPGKSETGERELAAALESARGGNRVRAQALAWQSLRHNPRRETAWLLLASLVPSREDQEMCLRQVLSFNPAHPFARHWFDTVTRAEHQDALPLPYVDDTAVPPPAEESQQPVLLGRDTVPVPLLWSGAAPAPRRPAAPGPRVLIVDDSATVRRLVSLALGRLGCEVIAASGGLEALGAMSHEVPDLVLLDVGLPNLDGHQICRAIKRSERTRGVPVIMLTGRDGLMDRLRGKMAGAAEYLTKPFDPAMLADVVRKYVRLAGS